MPSQEERILQGLEMNLKFLREHGSPKEYQWLASTLRRAIKKSGNLCTEIAIKKGW